MLATALATTLTLSVTPAMKNQAIVFLKPHAANDACDAFLKQHLEQAGITVTSSGIKRAAEIDEQKLIDQHYGSLADLAMGVQPGDMAVSPAALQAFEDAYGLKWAQALPSMLRNDDALAQLGVDGLGLEAMWRAGKQLKLAPGTRDSRIDGVTQTDFHDFESCADRNVRLASRGAVAARLHGQRLLPGDAAGVRGAGRGGAVPCLRVGPGAPLLGRVSAGGDWGDRSGKGGGGQRARSDARPVARAGPAHS